MVPGQPPPDEHAAAGDLLTGLRRFESLLRGQLAKAGLPERVFVDVRERHTMLSNVAAVLVRVDPDTLARSHYISKMVAASAAGLFDAALNYLWDELVNELRRRIAELDLAHFYDLAAGSSYLRKHLKNESDLKRIDDVDLLRAAREIGVLTDVGFQRLDHMRFMRNHASAAHPNHVVITGLDLANWLQICVEVVATQPDTPTGTTGRVLADIKKARPHTSPSHSASEVRRHSGKSAKKDERRPEGAS